mgnify:CR=1 FL=1
MIRNMTNGWVDEVDYVQPRTRILLEQLVRIMGMSANVEVLYKRGSNAVKYDSKEYGIHGEMDAGVFLRGTTTCLFPLENKSLTADWYWK